MLGRKWTSRKNQSIGRASKKYLLLIVGGTLLFCSLIVIQWRSLISLTEEDPVSINWKTINPSTTADNAIENSVNAHTRFSVASTTSISSPQRDDNDKLKQPPPCPTSCLTSDISAHSAKICWEAPQVSRPFYDIRGNPKDYEYHVFKREQGSYGDTQIYKGKGSNVDIDALKDSTEYTISIYTINPTFDKISTEACTLTFTTVPVQEGNLLVNPSFEQSSLPFWSHEFEKDYINKTFASTWEPFLSPYTLDRYFKRSGGASLKIASNDKNNKYGVIQHLQLDSYASQIFLSAWSATEGVSHPSDDGYCLHMDIVYEDDSVQYSKSLTFSTGTHDWEYQCMIVSTERKKIKGISVFIAVIGHQGSMWFDDITLKTEVTAQERDLCVKHNSSSLKHGCCPQRKSILGEVRPEREGFSIATQLTVDRLPALERMLQNWPGHISAAVYVLNTKDEQVIEKARSKSEAMRQMVDFHLVVAAQEVYAFKQLGLYHINALRNEALRNCRTSHALVLDADFVPNPGALQHLRSVFPFINSHPNVAFVAPAFEMDKQEEDRGLPSSKKELTRLHAKGTLRQIEINGTQLTNKQITHDGSLHRICMKLRGLQSTSHTLLFRWDERFVGYGFDKVQHIAELHFAGYKFMALVDVFVIHLDHGVPPWRGRGDMVRTRVYENYYGFLEETLAKYHLGRYANATEPIKRET